MNWLTFWEWAIPTSALMFLFAWGMWMLRAPKDDDEDWVDWWFADED